MVDLYLLLNIYCKKMNKVAWILVIIGGLNWGLVGIGGFLDTNLDLVDLLVGSWSELLADIGYILVGLSAVVLLVGKKKSSGGMQQQAQM